MKSAVDILYLSDADIIGVGAHKITYEHPHNKALCIKIAKHENDIDIKRELHYRTILQKKKKFRNYCPHIMVQSKLIKGQLMFLNVSAITTTKPV